MEKKIPDNKVYFLCFVGVRKPFKVSLALHYVKALLVVFAFFSFSFFFMIFYTIKTYKYNNTLHSENISLKKEVFSKRISKIQKSNISQDSIESKIAIKNQTTPLVKEKNTDPFLLNENVDKLNHKIQEVENNIEFGIPQISRSKSKIKVSIIVKNKKQEQALVGYLGGVIQFKKENVLYYLSYPEGVSPFKEDRHNLLVSGKKIKIKNYKNIKFEFLLKDKKIEKILSFKVFYALDDNIVKEISFDNKKILASNHSKI